MVVNVGRGTKWSRALAHVFARREELGSTDQMGLEEAGREAYRRWLRLGDVRAVDMKEEEGRALPTGIRPTSDLEQLVGNEVVGALTQISREHGSATGALVLTWGNGGDQLGHREIVAEELRGLVRQNQPPAGARREEATRASDGGGAETGEGQPTARVGGRAEPNQICHEPPPRIRTPGHDSVVFLDEVTRVMRARHAFGVLGDVVVHATPSRGRVERLYQQAVTRLGHTGQKRKQAGRPPCTS